MDCDSSRPKGVAKPARSDDIEVGEAGLECSFKDRSEAYAASSKGVGGLMTRCLTELNSCSSLGQDLVSGR
jgi:hypothetical protein